MIYIFSNYARSGNFTLDEKFKNLVDCYHDVMIHLNSCAFLKNNIEFFSKCTNTIITVEDTKSSCLSFMLKHKIVRELIFLGENIKVMPDMSRARVNCRISKMAQDAGYVFPTKDCIGNRILSTGFKMFFYSHYYFNNDDVTLVNFMHDSKKDGQYLKKFSLKHDVKFESDYLRKMNARTIEI